MKRNKKGMAILLVLLLACAAYFAYTQYETAAARRAAAQLTLSGNVDVREVSLAVRESDRIDSVLVDEGDTVKAGQVVATLDSKELQLGIQKLKSQIAAQQSAVDKLLNGNRPEDIRQAQANYDAAVSAAKNAAGVYNRTKQIYEDIQGVSRQELDTAQHDAAAKAATAEAAKQAWELAQNGARHEDIAAAQANLKALQDELAQEEYVLSQYVLTAPTDGVIRSRLLEPGDMASPSAPVFKLSILNKKWVRAYVKETDLGKIHEGQAAQVYIDSQPDTPIAGQIGYIADTAEFTPKTVQTDELRTALVYEVRVYVDDPQNVLRLGMPATVTIDLEGAK